MPLLQLQAYICNMYIRYWDNDVHEDAVFLPLTGWVVVSTIPKCNTHRWPLILLCFVPKLKLLGYVRKVVPVLITSMLENMVTEKAGRMFPLACTCIL